MKVYDYLKNARTPAFLLLLFIIAPILSVEETASPGALYVITLALPMCVYALSHTRNRLRNQYNYLAIALWLSCVISSIFGSYGVLGFNTIKELLLVLFFIFSTSYILSEKEIKFIFYGCFIIALLISVLVLLSYLGGYAHIESWYYMGRYSVGITGVYKNPNYLVSFLNIVLLIILYVLFLKKTKLLFTLLLVLVTILFVNAFYLSGARAAFLTMAFSILFVLLELVKTKRTNSVATLFVIGCLVLFVITFSYQGIMNRADMFIGNRSFTEDEGRSFSWIIAMNHWKESPVWGCGSESWSSIANSSSGMIWLHNIFLELLLNQGLIGVLLLILLVFSGYNKTKKEDRLFLIALVTVSAFPLFFQNGLWEMNFWRFILINRIAFNYSRYSKKGVLAAIIS